MAASGEFIGTIAFLLVGLGGIQAAAASNQAGLPTLASTSTVPNIQVRFLDNFHMLKSAALALLLTGVITPTRFILYVGAQLSASLVASALLKRLLPGPMSVVPNLAVGTSVAQGILIEAFITCALVLSVLFLAVEKHKATFLAPVGISITLFACHLFAVVFTGAAMNSARAFGPAAVTNSWKDHWVYWVGPTIGSLLAITIYIFMKKYEYWRLNEGQDTDVYSASPELFIARPISEEAPGRPRIFRMSKSVERVWFPGTRNNKNRSPSEAFTVDAHQDARPPV
ncbi:hypothetical protein PtA15_14A156 [Puccinia triticina]|uniref:Aquaporin n=1 Tax=Puccinia triticina TaxID=208348 RepID=A0ABY7D134_9BASI|nr:uncharacterized protein PtA15_14A156 [Puccinia triticina]WAQ91274.1 hypothetical protein PtA15_14A156 [Puccinia triticina]WAR62078.1 hypothetical protein PtB15_14B172 [Puccinia triticina]